MRAELSDLVVELQTIAASTGERQLRAQRAAAAIARAGGYRWVGLYDVGACGRILYIDDLVTDARLRPAAVGLVEGGGRTHGCTEVHLDSRLHREAAHRFYEREGFAKTCYHFAAVL